MMFQRAQQGQSRINRNPFNHALCRPIVKKSLIPIFDKIEKTSKQNVFKGTRLKVAFHGETKDLGPFFHGKISMKRAE